MTFPSDRNDPGDDPGRPAPRPEPGTSPAHEPAPGPPRSEYNALAVLSIIFAFLFAPLGIVFGHVAKRQIRRTGEQGGSLATAGLVISYLVTALVVAGCCAVAVLIATGWATVPGLT